MFFNRSSRRKRDLASNPHFIIPDFFLHLPCYGYRKVASNRPVYYSILDSGPKVTVYCSRLYGTLGLMEMGKFLWEGRGKGLPCWLSQFSTPKVTIAKFFWKMQRKTWYSILGLDAIPLSLKNLLRGWEGQSG